MRDREKAIEVELVESDPPVRKGVPHIDGSPVQPLQSTGELMPRRVSRPDTPRKAIREISTLYVAARKGEIRPEEATKLAFVARTAADLHTDHVLAEQVQQLKGSIDTILRALAVKGVM